MLLSTDGGDSSGGALRATVAAAPASTSLRDQILAKWGSMGGWNSGGIDRAQELADLLGKQGISSLGDISLNHVPVMGTEPNGGAVGEGSDGSVIDTPTTADQWTLGGKTLGYLGDYNNDGSFGNKSSPYAQTGDLIGWSARGPGNTGYNLSQAPDGSYYIAPHTGSSSDAGEVMGDLKAGAAIAAIAATAGQAWPGSLLSADALPAASSAVSPMDLVGQLPEITASSLPSVPALDAPIGASSALSAASLPAPSQPLAPLDPVGQVAPVNVPGPLPALSPAVGASGMLGPLKDWAAANPLLAKALFPMAGALLGSQGLTKSPTTGYSYNGPIPTVTNKGFQASVTPRLMQAPQGGGLLQLQAQGPQTANSGLWRYGLLGG